MAGVAGAAAKAHPRRRPASEDLPDAPAFVTPSAMTDQPSAPLTATTRSRTETVGDLMSPAIGVFTRDMSVAEVVEQLRDLTRAALITYCYVTDAAGKLEGLVVMRDMLLATPETRLGEIMLADVFAFREDLPLAEALKAALAKHFPVYPCATRTGCSRA